ncbi:MAG: hypothetical protein STHCBS139747_007015 [Sporothrix thermara]
MVSHGITAQLSDDKAFRARIADSAEFLAGELAAGKFYRLQSALVQHLNVGVLLPADKGQATLPSSFLLSSASMALDQAAANVDLLLRSHALPVAIVCAWRCSSAATCWRGATQPYIVRWSTRCYACGAPTRPSVVPLRGSIQAD